MTDVKKHDLYKKTECTKKKGRAKLVTMDLSHT